jgi:hypothetical protein
MDLAERVLNLGGKPEKRASEAKAHGNSVMFNAGDESPAYRPNESLSKLYNPSTTHMPHNDRSRDECHGSDLNDAVVFYP